MRNKFITPVQKILLLLAISCIFFAILFTSARNIIPRLTLHKDTIATWASELLNQPVQIKHVQASWQYFSPVLQFEDVQVFNDARSQLLIDIKHLGVRINLIRSLLAWRISIDQLLISGANLTVKQSEQGDFSIVGTQKLAKQFSETITARSFLYEITDWLFSQQQVIIDHLNIQIQGNKGQVLNLANLTLHLNNQGKQHQLIAKAAIAKKQHSSLLIKVKLKGTLPEIDKCQAELYLHASNIALKQWLPGFDTTAFNIKSGTISTDIWANWEQQQWRNIQTYLQLDNLDLVTHQQRIQLAHASTLMELRKIAAQTWSLVLAKIKIIHKHRHWPENHVAITIDNPLSQQPQIKQLQIAQFDNHMLALLKPFLPVALNTKIATLAPQGKLTHINFQKNHATDDFKLTANLQQIHILPWQKIPGLKNLSGYLQLSKQTGSLTLASQNIRFDFKTLFRNPIHLTALTGRINWFKQNNDWVIKVEKLNALNPDLQISSDGTLRIPPDDSGTPINLISGFKLLQIKHIPHYLPSGILSKKLLAWLDQAIIDGQSASGGLILRGNLKNFPFNHHEGKFLVLTKINDCYLNYKEQWPIIKHLQAILKFDADKMSIIGTRGSIYSSTIQNVIATIPHLSMKTPNLAIQGQLSGDLADGLRFIKNSPLAKTLDKAKAINVQGPMQLDLKLQIPLNSDAPIHLAGTAAFDSALLTLPQWNITLPLTKGNLYFTEQSISTNLLTGRLFENPIHLQILKDPEQHDTVVTAYGNIDVSQYLAQTFFKTWITGKTSYKAKLVLKNSAKSPDSLLINSDLFGVTIALPPPFNKTALEKKQLTSQITLTPNAPLPITLDIGKEFSTTLQLQQQKPPIKLSNTLFDKDNDIKVKLANVTINSHLPLVNWDTWQPYIQALLKLQPINTRTEAIPLKQINLQIDQLQSTHAQLNNFIFKLQPTHLYWRINIDSEYLKGLIEVPKQAYRPWDIKLDYLSLPDKSNQNNIPINLADIPALRFHCAQLIMDNKIYGKLSFALVPLNSHTQHITNLQLHAPYFTVNGSGIWQQQQNQHVTTIQGQLVSDNISKALTMLNLPASIISKDTRAQFHISYPSVPYDPSLSNLQGSISIALNDGQIIDIGQRNIAKIGLGRLLTLLSIKSITRRLHFDFSDLTQRHFAFDKMYGHFKFANGNAITKNFNIEGPIANITISGKIDLIAQDYDLKLTIMPQLTSSLPVIATIAGGPAVGALAWIADKIWSKEVNKIAQYRFEISGPWSKPIIKSSQHSLQQG